MTKYFFLIALSFIAFCCDKTPEDSLIIPPKFNEQPDVNNPQNDKKTKSQEDISKLKDLLLKSEE
jgi:hypothetical protein